MKEKMKLLLIKFLISLVVIFPISLITSIMLFGTVASATITTLISFCMSFVLSIGHTLVPNGEDDFVEYKSIKHKNEKIEEINEKVKEDKIKQLEQFKDSLIEQEEFIKVKIKERQNF